MVQITDGKTTIGVTKGAFENIFKSLGYRLVGEAEIGDLTAKLESDQTDNHEDTDTDTDDGKLSTEDGDGGEVEDENPDDEDIDPEDDDLSETPFSEMTKAELRIFAAEHEIDLEGTADRKDDLIEAIKNALDK